MEKCKCPKCGYVMSLPDPAPNPPTAGVMQSTQRFRNVAAAVQPPPGLSMSRETPVFLPTFEANIVVPRAKAITYGVFFGGAAAVPVTGILLMGGANVWDSLLAGATFGGVTFFISAAFAWHRSSNFYDSLLTRFEEMTGMDINGDGEIGDPDTIEIRIDNGAGQPKIEEWPVGKQALVWFAKAVVSDNPVDTFSETTARKAGMSRKQWMFIRDRFVTNRWAYWRDTKNPKLGLELTPMGGRKILQAIARGDMPDGVGTMDGDSGMTPHQTDRGTGQGNW